MKFEQKMFWWKINVLFFPGLQAPNSFRILSESIKYL